MRWNVLLLSVLVGCSSGDADDGSTTDDTSTTDEGDGDDNLGPNPDTSVNSYLPPDYVAAAPERVIYLGDSITAGAGAPFDDTYVSLLNQNNAGTWPDYD